jgi:hypothetical protein
MSEARLGSWSGSFGRNGQHRFGLSTEAAESSSYWAVPFCSSHRLACRVSPDAGEAALRRHDLLALLPIGHERAEEEVQCTAAAC